MRFFATNEPSWLAKWDVFVYNCPNGSHLVYSEWLKSYRYYGFDFEIGLVVNKEEEILGGFGAVIPKIMFFKFYVIPFGPVLVDNSGVVIKVIFDGLKYQAKKLGCCAYQLSVPYSNNKTINDFTYKTGLFNSYLSTSIKGKCFDFIYTGYGFNWLDLRTYKNNEEYINSLSPKVRRNIRIPYNKGLKCGEAITVNDIKKGYQVIQENAQEAGYSVRDFKVLGDTIFNLISKQTAKMLLIYDEQEIKAAGLFILTNKGYTNIMSGAKRTKPDLKLGYMLQYEIISESLILGKSGYDISMGGSKGVQEFKVRFSTKNIHFDNPHFYEVIKPFNFKVYKLFQSKLKPFKNKISKILNFIKGR